MRTNGILSVSRLTGWFLVLLAPLASLRADLLVYATNPTTAAGASGSFDILLTNNGTSSVDISSFNSAVEVAMNSGLMFTGADGGTVDTYIFGTVQSPPLGVLAGDHLSITVSDGVYPSVQSVAAGTTVGLAHVTYTLSRSTPVGPLAVTFSSGATQILDGSLAELPLSTPQGGTITVTSAAIPEPGSMMMSGLIVLGGSLVAARRAKLTSRCVHGG